VIALALLAALQANAAAEPAGDPVPDPPTLHCLGVSWTVRGDADADARVDVAVRKAGTSGWARAAPLFRVERGAAKTAVPDGAWLFAGSVVGLDPDAAYELKLALSDPDGGTAEKVLSLRTRAEPVAPPGLAEVRVRPGPRALRDAQRRAGPGTLFLLHAGTYPGTFDVFLSGEPGKPVVWRAAGDGEVVIDGGGESNVALAAGVRDVWFEGLTFRNGLKGLTTSNSSRVVVRRCRFRDLTYGIVCTANERSDVEDYFIADNVMEGPCTWPRTKGIEPPRAVQITGTGHVVCHNRIRGFADAIDTMPSPRCAAIDIYRNEIEVMTDDGIELDFSERNVRCFENRLTNVFQGISAQPVYGGPAYVFRNVLVNVGLEPFKLHQSPSGVLLYHNTVVKKGTPLLVHTPDPVRRCVSRNNLFVGSADDYAAGLDAPMVGCDFDRDGFSGGPWKLFLKWDGKRYATLDEVRRKAPAYRNAVAVEAGVFAVPEDGAREAKVGFEATLKPGSAAVDAGEALPGFNDGFSGAAPDLGAVETGAALPAYGPRK
jgi:hypothetical protein